MEFEEKDLKRRQVKYAKKEIKECREMEKWKNENKELQPSRKIGHIKEINELVKQKMKFV